METVLTSRLRGRSLRQWETLMLRVGLQPDLQTERTALVYQGDTLVAAGSRQGNILKCIAVDPDYQGQDLTATVLTGLRQDAFRAGCDHLFLYTKPENRLLFQNLFFYPIARTEQVLLMEDRQNGIRQFLDSLPPAVPGEPVGAAVMNCNPFTLGHRYLIETAARECAHLYVFVLSQEQPPFTAAQRLEMVRLGTADLPNVTVLPTGPYLISAATFPTYFLKDREQADTVHCQLDIAVFNSYFLPRFGITRRYVGTEPLSPMTRRYNEALKQHLTGCLLRELPRLEIRGKPVSAGQVRSLMEDGEEIRGLVPESTLNYLIQGGYYHV